MALYLISHSYGRTSFVDSAERMIGQSTFQSSNDTQSEAPAEAEDCEEVPSEPSEESSSKRTHQSNRTKSEMGSKSVSTQLDSTISQPALSSDVRLSLGS